MNCDALLALHHRADRSVGKIHHLCNLCQRADVVKLFDVSDLFLLRLSLCD